MPCTKQGCMRKKQTQNQQKTISLEEITLTLRTSHHDEYNQPIITQHSNSDSSASVKPEKNTN